MPSSTYRWGEPPMLAVAGANGIAVAGIMALAQLNDLMGPALNVAPWAIGVLLLLPELGVWVGHHVVVPWQGRFDRRRFMFVQLGVAAALTVGMAFTAAVAHTYWLMLPLAFLTGMALTVEPVGRTYQAAYLGTRRGDRPHEVQSQDGRFSAISAAVNLVTGRALNVCGVFGGLAVAAAMLIVMAFVMLWLPAVDPPIVDDDRKTAASSGGAPARVLDGSWLRRVCVLTLCAGAAVSVLTVTQPGFIAAKHLPVELGLAIGVAGASMGLWLAPWWSRATATNPVLMMLGANALMALSFLMLFASSPLDGAWGALPIVVFSALGTVAGTFSMVSAHNIVRNATAPDRLAKAKGNLINWRISGVVPGRVLGPVLVGSGPLVATAVPGISAGAGSLATSAAAGLLLSMFAVVPLLRWWRADRSTRDAAIASAESYSARR